MSGADLHYGIEIEFLSKGFIGMPAGVNAMHTKVSDLEKSFGGIGPGFARSMDHAMGSVVSSITDGLAAAATYGGGALAAGLGVAIKEGLSFNSYKESARIGLASIQSMLADTPFDIGMANADKSVEHLRKLSMTMPTTLKELMGTFQSVLPAALNAGLPMDRVESFAGKITVASAALGLNAKMAGHEAAALLEGRARSSMPLATRLGIHASEWNKLDATTRFNKLEKIVGKTDPALEAYRTSAMGLVTTGKDYGMQFASVFAAPLFYSLKTEGIRALDYLGKNEDSVNAMLTGWGVTLDHAFHFGLDKIHLWGPAVLTFGTTLGHTLHSAFARVEPYLVRFEKLALHFMNDPDAGNKLAGGAAMLLGGKAATSAASFGGDLLGDVSRLGPMLGAAGVGLGEMAVVSGVGIAALGALALGAYGATDILLDGSNRWHAGAVESVAHITANMTKLGEAGEKAAPALRGIADAYGSFVLHGIDFWTGAIANATSNITKEADALATTFQWLSNTLRPTAHVYSPNPWEYSPMGNRSFDASYGEDFGEKKSPKVINHNTTVHGGINIKVEGSTDPNRVAVKVVDIINAQARRGYSSNGASRFNVSP